MSNFISKLKQYFVARETSRLDLFELILMSGILFSIFFPIRYVLENKFNNILGYYSDFTALSIYLSFVLIIAFIIVGVIRNSREKNNNPLLLKFLVAFILGLILYQFNIDPAFKVISVYFYLRISCVLLFGYYVYKSPIWLKYKGFLLWILILIASTQSLIAVIQFYLQHSIGLNILGESPLSPTLYGVAKIVSRGTTYIRGYGTLPHPNILGAFLAISSLLNLHLLNKSKQQIQRIILSTTQFILIFGLFITFSRAALLSFGISLIIWGLLQILRNRSISYIKNIWVVPVAILFSLIILFPWLQSRGNFSDESAIQRSIYNNAGIQILKNNWVIGTGPGTNMFHMKQKLQYQLEPWDIQPIHNYWLLTLSEFGIIGLFICIFLITTFIKLVRKTLSRDNNGHIKPHSWITALLAISVCLFSLFWFDHFFYTIWPAQMFLWLFIGIVWTSILPRDNKE